MIKTQEKTNDIIRKAEKNILQLRHEILQAQAMDDQAQQTLNQLAQHAQQRMEELAASTAHLQALNDTCERSRNYADLAAGTGQEREATKQFNAAQLSLADAQNAYNQATQRAQKEEEREKILANQAQGTRTKQREILSYLHSKLAETQEAHEHACAERGNTLFQSALNAIKQQQSRIDAIQEHAEQERVILEQTYNEQIIMLTEYPDLAARIRNMQTPNDATSRVILAALAYIETLLAERHDLPTSLYLPTLRFQSNWLTLLAIPEDELWRYENITGGKVTLLSNRRENLQQLLKEYQEQKANIL